MFDWDPGSRADQAAEQTEYLKAMMDPRGVAEFMSYFYSAEFLTVVAMILAYKLVRVVIEKKL